MEGRTEPIFLPFMCRLRFFEINIDPSSATLSDFAALSFLMRSLSISLTTPATLEHLKFNFTFECSDQDFDRYAFYDDLRGADVWSHLNSIVTHPTGSRLQRVDIEIRYSKYGAEPDNDEILKAVFDSLPLLCEKGILFVEAVVY